MNAPQWCDVLETCPTVEEAVWRAHVNLFVDAFIIPTKRERWHELLTKRPRRIFRNSHKMHSDLDRRVCRRVEVLPPSALIEGVYYGFDDVARLVTGAMIVDADSGNDALFSLLPGRLAVYFFHEGETWLCQLPS